MACLLSWQKVVSLLVLIIAFLCYSPVLAAENITILEPGVPTGLLYLQPLQYAFFQVNVPDNITAFSLIISRDTTRAPLVAYMSTTDRYPSSFHSSDHAFFPRENTAYTKPITSTTDRVPHYFGVTVSFTIPSTSAASFSVMLVLFGPNDFYPRDNGMIDMPKGRLLLKSRDGSAPVLNVTWKPIPAEPVYRFMVFNQACNHKMQMNQLQYVSENGIEIHNETLGVVSGAPASVNLVGWDSSADAFCLNIISSSLDGSRSAIWMAETVYYPHEREPLKAEPINWKSWSPTTWVAITITACLFVGAPLGILIHRIWLSKRRVQKKRLQRINQTWIN